MNAPEQFLDWWEQGEEHLGTALGRLTDEEFGRPTLLPGWDRAHLLAHLARNADALVNLLTWARTGVETPMYPSTEVRNEQIEESARQSAPALRGDVLTAIAGLVEAMRGMPDEAWTAPVRTAQGRSVAATEVPWMRCREVWVHAVDLDAGVGFEEIPAGVLAALIDDVFRMWQRRGQAPDLVVFAGEREWGSGAQTVAGSLPAVTAWLTGRSAGEDLQADGALPKLPAWL